MLPIAEGALLLLVAALGHTAWHRAAGRRAQRAGLARFTERPGLGAYEEAAPRAYVGPRKAPHGVLLLHGFSGSAGSFKHLTPALERLGLPYYAPNLTGHGLVGGALMEAATSEDWLRDAVEAYDVVAAMAEEVSVVAFSFGTLLACELAKARPVRHLVLVGPYFHLKSAAQRKLRAVMELPGAAWAIGRLLPYIRKAARGSATGSDVRDASAAASLFAYPVVPAGSLREMWRTPHAPDFKALPCRSLDVLYGALEQASDVPALLAALDAQGVTYRARVFADSGHNLLEDHDREAAVAAVVEAIAPEAAARTA